MMMMSKLMGAMMLGKDDTQDMDPDHPVWQRDDLTITAGELTPYYLTAFTIPSY